jgi:DNA repair protein NreA
MQKKDCITCKGRYYTKPLTCGHQTCPIFSKVHDFHTTKRLEKTEFVGSAPSVFVGRVNYPNINVGILAPPELDNQAELYDAPETWSKRNFSTQEILQFRGALINSRFVSHVKSSPRNLETTQEVALSSKPIDIEFNLKKKPRYEIKTSDVETVLGARAPLAKAMLQSNPKIDRKVDYIVSDSDLKAKDSISILSSKGYKENFLTKILSVGTLGLKTQRKLVPTRWSITAVDDIVGKQKLDTVRKYKEISNFQLHIGSYMGNYFYVLLFPRVWAYELFELYLPSSLLNPSIKARWTTDHEFFKGRTKYAENCAGGYYAAKLPIIQYLTSIKRQATAIVFRVTTEEYDTPLGVWVVREAVRKSFENQPLKFELESEMLNYVKINFEREFRFDTNKLLRKSMVYTNLKTQKSLKEYF